MADIVIYTKSYCGYCTAAKRLLDQKDVAFQEIDVTNDHALWGEMVQLSGGMTVPQIFIDGQPVGGFTDLAALARSGRLDALLGLEGNVDDNSRSAPAADGLSAWLGGLWQRMSGSSQPR